MKKHILFLVAGAALAVAACNNRDTADVNINAGNSIDLNASAPDAAAPMPVDAQGFANAAAASDRFEIESSKLAATAASSADLKKFAAQMVTAHTGSTAKLKTLLSGMNPPLSPTDTLTADQQQKLDGLKGLKGSAFDAAYVSAQVAAHQSTLDMLKNYAASGDNDSLKAFANELIPAVTAHLNMANSLGAAMNKDLQTNDEDTNLSNGM